jgi:stage II sporulation protein AA (anti-sigma F factor antagonist)
MVEQVSVIHPKGRLDSSTSPAFEKDLLERVNQGHASIVLDLSGLTFISSAGLRTILLLAKHMKNLGGRLALCALSKPVREVFDATRCDTLIDIFPSYEAAAAHLSMR